jgi:hypothetical protein
MLSKWKWLVTILITIGLSITPSIVLGDAIITVTNTTWFSSGITSFTVTYVSDTEIDLSWTTDRTIANVMVRAKYGTPPANPPDANTAPSDGYLVYYGSGTSAVDTSMDMNQNMGTLYYSIWGQNADGTWNLIHYSGSAESREMLLLAFLGTFIGLIFVNAMVRRASFLPLRIILALTFVIPLIWVTQSPPVPFAVGSSLTTAVVVLIIGALLIFLFSSFRRQTDVTRDMAGNFTASGEGNGRWFWQNQSEVDEEREKRREQREEDYKVSRYRARVHRALNQDDYDSSGKRIR